MRDTEITLSGVTDENGVFKTSNKTEMFKFFRSWKKCRFILTIQVIPEEKSKKLDFYYRQYVLLQLQKGYLVTGEKLLIETVNENIGNQLSFSGERWFENLHNIEKLKALNQIKIFAASELGIFIEDPRAI